MLTISNPDAESIEIENLFFPITKFSRPTNLNIQFSLKISFNKSNNLPQLFKFKKYSIYYTILKLIVYVF